MTETLHPQVAALLAQYREELRDTLPSDSLDARIDRLVAGRAQDFPRRRMPRLGRAAAWATAAGVMALAIGTGVLIGMLLERGAGPTRLAQETDTSPADFSLWPSDSVALQIPAEYSAQGKWVAVDPQARGTGKRYWIDVVVSNDGTVRIDRIVPAEPARNENGDIADGITLQTP